MRSYPKYKMVKSARIEKPGEPLFIIKVKYSSLSIW